jgi:pyruvate dehydrogenase E2 component (dihydrolipoamide acetyltransferase)
MPALSPTMKEGKITRWLKKEGDKVSSGEAVAECETDKSNLEIEAYEDGILLKILVKEGESAPVGAPIGYIGEKGEKIELPAPAPVASSPTPSPQPSEAARAQGPPTVPAPSPVRAAIPRTLASTPSLKAGAEAVGTGTGAAQVMPFRREGEPERGDGRLRASPLARRMAEEQGLDLGGLHGSGPQGRIIKRDVEAVLTRESVVRKIAPAPVFSPPFERRDPEEVPLSSMRRVIAQRLSEVKPGVPHFYLTVDVEMDAAMKIRDEAKALESKVSVNDIIVKAAAIALRRVPRMNVSLQGDRMLQYHTVDVGIAVAIEEGLITPILRDADQKGLASLSAESRDLAERARKKALKPQEYTGGSLTVSNLGMYGIDSFVAVINPPQAAILAVGAVASRAVVRNGEVAVKQMMSITLSGDHRVIDGALGAEYLREVKGLLEHPMRLLF